MEILVQGQMVQQDYLRAYLLHYKPSKISTIFRIGVLAFVSCVALIDIVSEFALLPALPMLVIVGSILCLPWWQPRLIAITHWKTNEALREPISGTIGLQTICLTGLHFTSEVSWGLYRKYKRSSDTVLLYQTPQMFNIFPKTIFKNEDDWITFNQLVEENVNKLPKS